MAAINFPSAPVNDQEHSENGVNYRYSSSIGAWLVIKPSLLANTSNQHIVFNYNDSTMGSNGLMFERSSNTFIAANIVSRTNVTAQYYFGDGSKLVGIVSDYSPAFHHANAAFYQANQAFVQANTANSTAVGNTLSGVFTLRTNRNGLNFIPGSQIREVNVDDWAAGERTNVTIHVDVTSPFLQANTAHDHANLAFLHANNAHTKANDAYTRANTANATAVGNTLSGIFTLRTNRNGLNFIPGTQVRAVNIDDWSAGERTNVTINVDVTSPFLQANTAHDHANLAFLHANNAHTKANDAYTRANVANQYSVGNTLSSVFTLRTSARTRLNFIPGTNITINVDDDSAGDRANITITASSGSSGFTANIGNGSANTFNVAHGLNKQFCLIQVREYENGGYYVYPDIRHMNPNDCIIQFVTPPSTNQYVVIVSGVA